MKRFFLLIAVFISPTAALADWDCEELWFTRNLIMDRAGYCFGSTLGQSLFDNRGCSKKSVSLVGRLKRMVGDIRKIEKEVACGIDTTRRDFSAHYGRIGVPDRRIRMTLDVLPMPDQFPGGCLGWTGRKAPLRSGPGPEYGVIGWIEPGDFVGVEHAPEGPWGYVTTYTKNWELLKSGGWSDAKESCADYAG